jgi:hypothetical protein
MNHQAAMISVLDSAIERATVDEDTKTGWRAKLVLLDLRIERLDEQVKARPTLPTELQDDYRREIDAISLENAQLKTELEKTKTALKKTAAAYKEEVSHTTELKQHMDELERRVLRVLNRE